MNGYFVRQDILEKLDQIEMLRNIINGTEERPEEYKELSADEIKELVQTCQDTIESIDADLEQIAEWIAGDYRNNDMTAKAYKAEKESWQTKQYKAEQRAKADKELLMLILKKHNLQKMDAGKFKLSIANNGGKTPILFNVLSPEELPAKFKQKITTYKADDAAIREYLDAGRKSKYFEYGQRGQNLRIK